MRIAREGWPFIYAGRRVAGLGAWGGRADAVPSRPVPARRVRQGQSRERAGVGRAARRARAPARAPDRGAHRAAHRHRRRCRRPSDAGSAHGHHPVRLTGGCVRPGRRPVDGAGGGRRPRTGRGEGAGGVRVVTPSRPAGMRRVVIVVPSLFTLFNLFFGIWSMVLASRGEFYRAGWYIFFAGVLDALDGRVARLSRTGTRFGAELASLVDVVSFGVAPAFLIYQLEFATGGQAEWIFCYFSFMAAAIRLARFNIPQAGRAKRYFIGLPSPAAGMTLATFFPFTTTDLYQHAFRFLPRHHLMQLLMILLTILMVSNVRYATMPRAGVRTLKGLLGLATILFILIFGILEHDAFFFPLGIAYMVYGILRATLLGFFFEEDDDETDIAGPIVIADNGAVAEVFGPPPRVIAPREREGEVRDERVPDRGARQAARRPARSSGPGGGACPARPGLRRGGPGADGQAPGARGEGGVARRIPGPCAGDVRPAAREPRHRGLRTGRGRRGRSIKRVAVIVFPGSNCVAETLAAARAAGSDAYFVWHADTDLRQADVVILPGGFSYGDYLRSGAIARFSNIMGAVTEHARAGGAVLGICNGFQILCEAGLLPGGLMRNARLRFLSRPVWVRVEQTDTQFTCLYEKGEVLEIPVAHGDGRYGVDARTAAAPAATDRVVWRYVRGNPNGSVNEIAGVTNAGRNVVGIMPHPERRDAPALGGQDGARVFHSMEARHATQHAADVRAVDDRHLRV